MEPFEERFDPFRDWMEDGEALSGQAAGEEERLAVEQACEILGLRADRVGTEHPSAGPITEEDRNLIIWNIDELFLA
jgi:hypothetical protein